MTAPLAQGETILNKYKIVQPIGEGGMARVWLAQEITFGDRQVALKEARQDLPAAELADVHLRYAREVQICADLEKAGAPNVVRAITAELYGDGLLLVMEYLAGGDLAALIRQHSRGAPVEQVLSIGQAALQALAVAHNLAQEVVHRDIKPQNILLDSQGRAHLGDWGLAQRVGISGRSRLAGGAHPGDPLYMAPEQAASADYLTPAADLFALGCVLFELLTGQRYRRVKPGTPVSAQRAGTPDWLDSVLAKALAADPWERYQSAEEMGEALSSSRPVELPRPAAPSVVTAPAPAPPARKRSLWRWLVTGEWEETPPARNEPDTSRPAAAQSSRPQVLTPPFIFRNGKQARNLVELVRLCTDNPVDAMWHLQSGQFAPWLEMVVKDRQLARLSLDLRREKLGSPARLQKFLDATGVNHGYYSERTMRFDWVTIPAGPFWMGSDPARDKEAEDDEKPQHLVEVAEFRIARVPVTNAQYKIFRDATGDTVQIPVGYENHPVDKVNWNDAQAFCEWAGVRLPTEAEWEKAARGIDGRIYPWGFEAPNAKRCNFNSLKGGTSPVGQYRDGASPYGVLDMAGNVWEWTCSLHRPYPYRAGDGREDLSKRRSEGAHVLRGGSWADDSANVRCALRSWLIPFIRDVDWGFRVVSVGAPPRSSDF